MASLQATKSVFEISVQHEKLNILDYYSRVNQLFRPVGNTLRPLIESKRTCIIVARVSIKTDHFKSTANNTVGTHGNARAIR